ncbi:MAG: hypothetical protein CVT86_08500 [Alphaproteobacteria bacterium HGW-Alphaproteobacteria-8]|jgi:hypothetical protein|nr:MAG: hypothetical protein CVT86_08500 [Alphaproteobacteria bacterium HGW-Alphaproteobacteria-8]
MTAKFAFLGLCGFFAAAPALAEVTVAQRDTTLAVWQSAFDDWAPTLTCGATMTASDEFVRKIWQDSKDEALAAMQAAGWPEIDLADLRAKADADALRLPPDTLFADVLSYCAAHPDWSKKASQMRFLPLATEVRKALSGATP